MNSALRRRLTRQHTRYGFSGYRNHGHKVLTDVYYIPELKSNIVSLGQLEEEGFKYVGEDGRMCVFDQERALLISAPRTENRLYLAKFGLSPPVCMLTQSESQSWLWHARYGHLNFRALNDLNSKEMVDGLPVVTKVEKVCDGCVLENNTEHHFLRCQATEQRSVLNWCMLTCVGT